MIRTHRALGLFLGFVEIAHCGLTTGSLVWFGCCMCPVEPSGVESPSEPVEWVVQTEGRERAEVLVRARSVAGPPAGVQGPLLFWDEARVVAVFAAGSWLWVRAASAVPALGRVGVMEEEG